MSVFCCVCREASSCLDAFFLFFAKKLFATRYSIVKDLSEDIALSLSK